MWLPELQPCRIVSQQSQDIMAKVPSIVSTAVNFQSGKSSAVFRRDCHFCPKVYIIRCNNAKNQRDISSTGTENMVLKVAWYGSELLGIVASLLRSSPTSSESKAPEGKTELASDGSGVVDRSLVVDAIKEDFLRSYFVTGNLTMGVYEEECEFADPAGSFKGLRRFKRNCTNFGYLVRKSNMKLVKWEDFGEKAIGHWRFSCVLAFPWKPILSATGYTEYYFNKESGKVCRHVEHWNVSKTALFKQILSLKS
ncbi:unnamed protein product [Cuscuta epithymum]|uniref:Uncharacterized protein n=1 Tax=Cuscuta epithymum TaxID=186058 RepID=A0AAV0DC90_9ASTE|nr:unnamed protein product [Cuscuta epithymum]